MRKLLPFALLAVIGCGSPQSIDPVETTKDEPTTNAVKYPAGPYGYYQGSIVANLTLTGQRDTNKSGVIDTGDTITPIHLSDYYNDGKTKVLVVMVAAEWCGPCKAEQPGLVQMWNGYGGHDGEVQFLEAMIQNVQGQPADMTVVDRWAKTYAIPFDMAADPTVALGPYYNVAAFPMQMVIQTKDMSIQWQNNGLANEQLQGVIDGILASN